MCWYSIFQISTKVWPTKTHIQTVADFQDTQRVFEHILQRRVAKAACDSQNLHVRVCQGHHEGLSIIDPNVPVIDQLLHPTAKKGISLDKQSLWWYSTRTVITMNFSLLFQFNHFGSVSLDYGDGWNSSDFFHFSSCFSLILWIRLKNWD